MLAYMGDRDSNGYSYKLGGAEWHMDPRSKKGFYAFVDVSDFTDSTLLIGQPVALIPHPDYGLQAKPVSTAVATKSVLVGVFLGFGEGVKPVLNKTKANATADGIFAFQTNGLVDEARVLEASGFVDGNLIQLAADAPTTFEKSDASNTWDIEVCGVVNEDCNAGTTAVLHAITLSQDPIHSVPAT